MNLRRVFLSLYLAIFAMLTVAAVFYFVNVNAEYKQVKATEAKNQRRLADAEKELKDQERILQRLRTDPAYVERIIRRKLGYAKEDESIFRFGD